MRILITGVNGFVGKALFHFFNEKSEIVYGTFRSGNAINECCYKTDLTLEEEVNHLFNVILKDKIDVVIHTASIMAEANNLHDLSVINDNTKLAQNIAVAIKKTAIKQVINFSSASVYPNVNGVFSETSELNPSKNSDCFYGLSKLNAEVVFNYLLGDSKIKLLHLRIGVIYGNNMNQTRLIPVLENELAQKNTLTLYANGERYINQIHIDKLCNYIYLFALKSTQGIFNVANEYLSTKEIAEKILKEKGNKESKIILLPQGNKNLFKLDIEKLNKWLNV